MTDAPSGGDRSIERGLVLNGLYRLLRRLGRGGMGEVWEGVNVSNPRDRVAIKFLKQDLAEDDSILRLFRHEAELLSRLKHDAIVSYRVAAYNSELDRHYIVMEYIDGEPLSDVLGQLEPTPENFETLLRRLADGMCAVHRLAGVYHRDLSPDNIMLPDGKLERATIIDFGIAKSPAGDLEGTVPGFKGKYSFVAPEQLGAFDGEINTWTDVYGLGLTMLAFSAGRPLPMGGDPVRAIEARQRGVDVSSSPEAYRQILAGMVAYEPKRRIQNMETVLERLDVVERDDPPGRRRRPSLRKRLIPAAAVVVVLALLGGSVRLLMRHPSWDRGSPASRSGELIIRDVRSESATAGKVPVASASAQLVNASLARALAALPCSWLVVESVEPTGAGFRARISGVAQDAETSVTRALARARREMGYDVSLDRGPDAPSPMTAPSSFCGALDLLRSSRPSVADDWGVISTPSPAYVIAKGASGATLFDRYDKGRFRGSQPVDLPFVRDHLDIRLPDRSADFALIEFGSRQFNVLVPSKAWMKATLEAHGREPDFAVMFGGDNGRFWHSVLQTPPGGPEGYVLATGRGPSPFKDDAMGPMSPAEVATALKRSGWSVYMVWYDLRCPPAIEGCVETLEPQTRLSGSAARS